MTRHGLWVWTCCWLYALQFTSGQTVQHCPALAELAPCVCTVKKNGLDIMCEFTDLPHISRAMAVLKGKPSIVIYYLKLRHNNLPKLQSFVFLGMDIRHLTIHNSSLAVVEESSLSSMGTFTPNYLAESTLADPVKLNLFKRSIFN